MNDPELLCLDCQHYSVSLDDLGHELYSCRKDVFDELGDYPVVSLCPFFEGFEEEYPEKE